ncbi:hypothetical protein Tco_0121418, partial [Tanacetum coccineum]
MFDEYFQPSSVVSRAPAATVAQIPVATTDTPSSNSVDQDAQSASTSPTTKDTQASVVHQDVEGQETPNVQFDNDPFTNIFNSDPSSEESSSRDVIELNLHPANQPFEHLSKWTKNHPLDNVIGAGGNGMVELYSTKTEYQQADIFLKLLNGLQKKRKSNGGNSS